MRRVSVQGHGAEELPKLLPGEVVEGGGQHRLAQAGGHGRPAAALGHVPANGIHRRAFAFTAQVQAVIGSVVLKGR